MNIKSRIWIESDKRIFLGVGRIRLLEQIQQDGSINKACKSLNMSYKKAWKLVDEMNAVSKTPVVEKASGGSGGGGTIVTPFGIEMIQKFRSLEQKAIAFFDDQESEFK